VAAGTEPPVADVEQLIDLPESEADALRALDEPQSIRRALAVHAVAGRGPGWRREKPDLLVVAEHAAVAGAAPLERRGSAFGLAAIHSFGNFAASVGVGLIWALVSPVAAFAAIAVLMTASAVALSRVSA
jgi:hypothetical protein